MIAVYKFERFEFQSFQGFIWDLIHRFQIGQIRFSPLQGASLFNEHQLTHIGQSFDLNNTGDFLFAWSRNVRFVRVVTFEQFHKNGTPKIKVTFDLDEKIITLESAEGIREEDIKESLKKFFVLKETALAVLSKRWWDKGWFQWIMLFGAIAGIFGIYFVFFPPASKDGTEVLMSQNPPIVKEAQTVDNVYIQGYSLLDLSTAATQTLLEKVRSEHGVRQLLPLESGKKLVDISPSTYSFLSVFYFEFSSYDNYEVILNKKADRFNPYGNFFEVHKLANDKVYLLGFVSEETYTNINAKNEVSLTLFPGPDSERKYLVVIPINTIKESQNREIAFAENKKVGVLDIKIKGANNLIINQPVAIDKAQNNVEGVPSQEHVVWWKDTLFGYVLIIVVGRLVIAYIVFKLGWNK